MPDLNESYGFNARRTHRAYDRLLNHYLSHHGIKTGYWYYLRLLWVEDGLSQKQLSDANNVAENTTALTLQAMQRDGLVYRERDLIDRRRWKVFLTDDARALRVGIIHFADEVNNFAIQGISKADLVKWLKVSKLMAANLEKTFRMSNENG